MPAIRTTGPTERFGADVLAVDFDPEAEHCETFAFFGSDGVGKSTTIDVLFDFVRPSEGTAEVLGFDARCEGDPLAHRRPPRRCDAVDPSTGYERLEWVFETNDADEDPDELAEGVGRAERPSGSAIPTVIARTEPDMCTRDSYLQYFYNRFLPIFDPISFGTGAKIRSANSAYVRLISREHRTVDRTGAIPR